MQDMTNGHRVLIQKPPASWIEEAHTAAILAPEAAVLLLPERFEAGIAIFPDPLTTIAKELRIDGANVDYLLGPRGKVFVSRYSAEGAGVIVGILLNVFSNSVWDSTKLTFQLLRARLSNQKPSTRNDIATIRIGISESPDGTKTMWQEVSGPTEAAFSHAETVARLYFTGSDKSRSE